MLWCLGLFDRPFKPERPVIGNLRPRSTKDHANRLNMAAYAAKIKGPVFGEPLRIAVIGSGLSGLFAAKILSDHGHKVQVFEKTDRPGGRCRIERDGNGRENLGCGRKNPAQLSGFGGMNQYC